MVALSADAPQFLIDLTDQLESNGAKLVADDAPQRRGRGKNRQLYPRPRRTQTLSCSLQFVFYIKRQFNHALRHLLGRHTRKVPEHQFLYVKPNQVT